MRKLRGVIAVLVLIFTNALYVQIANALTVTYSYEGNNFVEFDGEPGVFSTDDKVVAEFELDCALAHPEGNCINLPYADYAELGTIGLETHAFSAGPARLPAADGSVNINRFFLSTDSTGRILQWDVDLGLSVPSGLVNVDTDNQGDGLDSATALGGNAVVRGLPGNWENDLAPTMGNYELAVEKSVDNSTPAGVQQTVEFTVEVSNAGPEPAPDVIVIDKLPADLVIPEGMAAFASAGDYDPSSGRWQVGEMEAGVSQVLTIPAIIETQPQPVCVLNFANVDAPADSDSSNDSSYATLRRPGVERCVDVDVKVTEWNTATNPCLGTGSMWYSLTVSNAGPDEARNVVLDITETLYQAPGFSIDDRNPDCSGLQCNWALLGAGQNFTVLVASEEFQLESSVEHAIQAIVSSDVEDYQSENNALVSQHTLEPFREVNCDDGPNFDFSGAGGGCFIATAAYGSYMAPQVQTLREFRDNVLLKSSWGGAVVDIYYRYSPGPARLIAGHEGLRTIARGILLPVVFAVSHPWQALLLFLALAGCGIVGTLVVIRQTPGH